MNNIEYCILNMGKMKLKDSTDLLLPPVVPGTGVALPPLLQGGQGAGGAAREGVGGH